MKSGKVYIVGAGPGEFGLITQKALDYLAEADVVVYDHLINERLLEMASPKANKIYSGKIAGQHAREQIEINKLLVKKAKEGKIVVRLKGGDPFVFGRGGEEAEVLSDNNIPFEVVPGISSAIAVPAYAGIPLTHRQVASSFTVITGHEDPQKNDSSIKWETLATGADTLVFLMGVKNLPTIVSKLMQFGRSPKMPVAIIKDGTKPEQQTLVGCLEDIVNKAQEKSISPPAIIVVGKVVGLREKLRWFDNRPLFGKRILVTRACHQSQILSDLLVKRGAQPIELPAIEIKPLEDTLEIDRAISNLCNYQWILFTSVNGVHSFFEYLYSRNLDARALANVKCGTIGPATAEALKIKGISPDYVPTTYTSRGVVAGLKRLNLSGERFLIPRADIADEELTRGIRKLGGEVDTVALYRTLPTANAKYFIKPMLQKNEIDVITFTSSSTVANLVESIHDQKKLLHNVTIACIGPKTARTAAKAGLNVAIVAQEHTIPGLVAAMENHFLKET